MIWPIRYFFITAGTGRLRYEFLLPFLQTGRVDGKPRVRNLHHIKVKSVRGVTISLKSMVVFLKKKMYDRTSVPDRNSKLAWERGKGRIIFFRVQPVGRRSRGGQVLIANSASRRRPFPVENSRCTATGCCPAGARASQWPSR